MSDQQLILVADDDEDILALVTIRLRRAGYDVVSASNGEDALRLAKERRPALAVLDVMMPRLDGYGVIEGIRADPELASMPVILLSARVRREDVGRGMEAGADDYLSKPFKAEQLIARVAALLNQRAR